MKIMTILGTRPEIIRLSRIIPILDEHCDHILVHTGQNYDTRLSDIFFEELGVRKPNENMQVKAKSFGAQIAQILEKSELLFHKYRPDRLLILGDTNSGMAAIIARRLGIPVYHMEAGNRCFDDRVPEEINRRVIDHASSVFLPYTERSRENLLKEGFHSSRIYVTGNPIKEVLDFYRSDIDRSNALDLLKVEEKKYFLVTMHRAENVDIENRLRSLIEGLELLHREWGLPVIISTHPRTRSKIESFSVVSDRVGLSFADPFGFFDFVKLEKSAFCLISDSGTVQEEACIFGVPNITIRDVTERPETVECGSNLISGSNADTILKLSRLATGRQVNWTAPKEYETNNVSDCVSRIVLSYRIPDAAESEWLSGN